MSKKTRKKIDPIDFLLMIIGGTLIFILPLICGLAIVYCFETSETERESMRDSIIWKDAWMFLLPSGIAYGLDYLIHRKELKQEKFLENL